MITRMKTFYVCSSDTNVTETSGNATFVLWKNCTSQKSRCPVVKYFLEQPVKFTKGDFGKYIFNFSTDIDISKIRESVYEAQGICKKCQLCNQKTNIRN